MEEAADTLTLFYICSYEDLHIIIFCPIAHRHHSRTHYLTLGRVTVSTLLLSHIHGSCGVTYMSHSS